MTLLELLQKLDTHAFYLLNADLTTQYLDVFFPFLTDFHKIQWVRYGLFPAFLVFLIYKVGKKFIFALICLIVTIGICDATAYYVLKKSIQRPRPNHLTKIDTQLKVLYNEPKDPSFPSNHATNSAGAATTLLWFFPHLKLILIPFVILIGWSRVYVGVHFPSDVIAGWILGVTIAYLLRKLIFQRLRF